MLVVGNQHGRVPRPSRVALLLLLILILLPVWRISIRYLLLRLLVSHLLLLQYLLLTGKRYPSQPTSRSRRGTRLICLEGVLVLYPVPASMQAAPPACV